MRADAQPHVVRVSARQENGKTKVTEWSRFADAMEASAAAARLRSFGWRAYAVDERVERAAKLEARAAKREQWKRY
jgi:hypothetical protein